MLGVRMHRLFNDLICKLQLAVSRSLNKVLIIRMRYLPELN
jgi:hypothetical protein